MFGFHEKRKLRRLLYSPVGIVPLALIVFLLGTSVWGVYTKERETRERRDKEAQELESLTQRAAALEAEIERLSTKRGREEEIRSKFEVAREGEHVIIIVDPKSPEDTSGEDAPKSLWRRFLSWF